jgi:ATP-dependent helicase HrpA
VLLAETRTDRFLEQYDTIIVDEAHERSLNIDFLLGNLKRLLPKRPDLRVIITSATIDAARFAEHFGSRSGPAPIIEVSGRMYPVEVRWRPLTDAGRRGNADETDRGDEGHLSGRLGKPANAEEDEGDPQRAILDALDELAAEDLWDVLIFQPTEWDIHETAKLIRGHMARRGWTKDVELLPLYARLSLQEQQRVFEPRGSARRIVIATNVAESSLTVPRIRAVIDTGTARISRYSPRSKMQRLPIEAVSQASADQRKGRCGRIGPGVCIRLFSEQDYAARERFTPPEILRTNLASVILQTQSLNLGPIEEFPFLEPPKPTAIRDGYKTLFELGAVNERNELSELGRKLAKLPVDPRIARIILAGHDEACLNDILIIAAALEAQDPRDRPIDKQQQADEKHKPFQHPDSDFLSYLKVWDFFHHLKETLSKGQVRKACAQNFLNFNRLREWADLHRQLQELAQECGLKTGKRVWAEAQDAGEGGDVGRALAPVAATKTGKSARPTNATVVEPVSSGSTKGDLKSDAIHRALLTGFLSSIAQRSGETSEYLTGGGLKGVVWPGSGTFAKKPKWVVAAEVVETSKQYLRTVARIDPAWIEALAGHLVTRTQSEPHWDRDGGSAAAFEKVSLFGLTIVPRRKVRLGRINPTLSRELLIQHGLVEADFDCDAPFFKHNRALIAELEELRVKSRRADFLKGEDAQFEFYDKRLPADVVDGVSLMKWLKGRGPTKNRNPSELASVEPGLCTTGQLPPKGVGVVQRPDNHQSKLGGGSGNVDRTSNLTANERSLFFSRDDLLNPVSDAVTTEDFPSELKLQHLRVPLQYKLNPGESDDGITISVPQEGLNQLDSRRLGWLVPGLIEQKITALIKSLPKELRRMFVPVPDTTKEVLKQIKFGEGNVTDAMAAILSKLSGQRVNAEDFREVELPTHLRINIKVVGAQGKQLAVGRDVDELRNKLGAKASASFSAIDHSMWNRDGLTDWDFDVLPESVDLQHSGLRLKGFPSLLDRGENVSLRLADSAERAAFDTRLGLRRLFVIAASKELKKQVQHLPELSRWQLLTATLPDKGKLPQQLAELIAERAFFATASVPLPRTKIQFQERVRAAKLRIPPAVQEVIELIGPLITAYTDARRAIDSCKLPFAQTAIVDCRDQLARLTEAGFLITTPWDWLQQCSRYLQAISLRIKKLAAAGQARDQRAALDVAPRWRKLTERLDGDRKTGRYDPDLLTCRWMLEELRVSLFAQELRTAIPISPQRWDKQFETLTS